MQELFHLCGTKFTELTEIMDKVMSGKSFRIEERLKTQSGEENSSSGRFNPVGRLQQSLFVRGAEVT